MVGLFLRFHAAECGTPDRVSGLVVPEIERGIDLQRHSEFVAALLNPAGGAMDKRKVFVGARPIGRAAQAGVEALLQQSRGVSVLAVLEGSYPESKFRLALARERPASGHHQANEQRRERAINGHSSFSGGIGA